jgi:hypothetical protein
MAIGGKANTAGPSVNDIAILLNCQGSQTEQ